MSETQLPSFMLKGSCQESLFGRSPFLQLLEHGPRARAGDVLNFFNPFREGEDWLTPNVLLERASQMTGREAGQHHLEWMLQMAGKFPVAFRDYKFMATGTRWLCYEGDEHVTSLSYYEDKWKIFRMRVLSAPGNSFSGYGKSYRIVRVGGSVIP